MSTEEGCTPAIVHPSELYHVLRGTVQEIHNDLKDSSVSNTPDFMRFQFDLKELVCNIRGERFGRFLSMKGEDFFFVLVRQRFQLSCTLVKDVLTQIRSVLIVRFGIDLSVEDLCAQVPRNVPISEGYTMLDLLFVCHALRNDNLFMFIDNDRILCLQTLTPRPVEKLSLSGEQALSH